MHRSYVYPVMKHIFVVAVIALNACGMRDMSSSKINQTTEVKDSAALPFQVVKTEEEWKQLLTPEQYVVLRGKGTERPFTGKFNLHKEKGMYLCAACGNELFPSDTKFDSGCGWPSFFASLDSTRIRYETDNSHGMVRTEIMCAQCGGHLGHVFDDGPQPTGLRYCVNSVSLNFKKLEADSSKKTE